MPLTKPLDEPPSPVSRSVGSRKLTTPSGHATGSWSAATPADAPVAAGAAAAAGTSARAAATSRAQLRGRPNGVFQEKGCWRVAAGGAATVSHRCRSEKNAKVSRQRKAERASSNSATNSIEASKGSSAYFMHLGRCRRARCARLSAFVRSVSFCRGRKGTMSISSGRLLLPLLTRALANE